MKELNLELAIKLFALGRELTTISNEINFLIDMDFSGASNKHDKEKLNQLLDRRQEIKKEILTIKYS